MGTSSDDRAEVRKLSEEPPYKLLIMVAYYLRYDPGNPKMGVVQRALDMSLAKRSPPKEDTKENTDEWSDEYWEDD